MLATVDAVIEAMGGTAAAAAVAGVGAPAVSNWKKAGIIPAQNYMAFSRALAAIEKEADPCVFGFRGNPAPADDPSCTVEQPGSSPAS